MPNIHLSTAGREQAEHVGRRLACEQVDVLQTSPQTRAQETAEIIAAHIGLTPEIAEAFAELDVGDWTGASFDILRERADWRGWNEHRASARAPNGESMQDAQDRAVNHLAEIARSKPGARIVIVSHSDVIKAAILYHLRVSLDHCHRIEIAPASISTIVIGEWGAKLLCLNETVAP